MHRQMIKQTYSKVSLCGFIAAAFSPSPNPLFIRFISVPFAFAFLLFFFHLFFRKYKRNIRKVRCLCALFNPSAFWYFFPLRLYHLLCTTHSMRKMSYFKCDTLDKQWSKKKNESNNNNNNNNLCLTVYCGDFADYSSLVCLVYNCKVAAILIAERAMPNYFHAK